MPRAKRAVLFFADVLGFSHMASQPGAGRALSALTDVARLFKDDAVGRVLRGSWKSRYGLSDSLMLVGSDAATAAADAARFAFSLAFYHSETPEGAVLVRGALVSGEVRETGPLFPETGRANLVGEALVRAVLLEKGGAKGPRLLVSKEVARRLSTWLLDDSTASDAQGGGAELLWPLPPEPDLPDADLIGAVARSAVTLFERHAQGEAGEHYTAYLDLVARSLLRLREDHPAVAKAVVESSRLARAVPLLERLLRRRGIPEAVVLQRIEETLLGRRPRPTRPRRRARA